MSPTRFWHRAAVAVVLALAVPLLPAAAAPSALEREPLEIVWQVDEARSVDGLELAVDARSGDVLALTTPSSSSQLRRLDRGTGEVEWVLDATGMSRVATDGAGGAVLAGTRAEGQSVVFLSESGAVVGADDSRVDAKVVDLVVDPGTGRACTLGAHGRRSTGRTWVTSCWTPDGTLVFSRASKTMGGLSSPHALAIDPRSRRVYVVGASAPYARRGGARQDVVLLAYAPDGGRLWQARSSGAGFPTAFDILLDPGRRRVHLLGQALRFEDPMMLLSFDARGRKRFDRSWVGPDPWHASTFGVTSTGDVLVVSAEYRRAELRSYAPSGRLVRKELVRLWAAGEGSWVDDVAIDTRRRLVHLIAGDGLDDPPSTVVTLTAGGRPVSRVEVDARSVLSGTLEVHHASGRVYAGTTVWSDKIQRISALR